MVVSLTAKAAFDSNVPPMDKLNPKPASDRFDSLAFSLARYAETPRRLSFQAGSVAAAKAWQSEARARLAELVGIVGINRVPLEPVWGDIVPKNGYTRRPVTFSTRAEMSAFAYWLVPGDGSKKLPTMICLPGHGRGVDDLVGIDEDGNERDHYDGYQHDYAIQFVRNGYATLALEPLGFGHRRDLEACKGNASTSSCQPASGSALMLGESMVGWRVWDVMRAIDLLVDRPEVDPDRIGVMGISGGGTVTLYAGALDERVFASFLSCSYCTFKHSIFSLSHCIDNYVPGILRWFEAADLAALIAPRRMFCEAGVEDRIFPKPGVEAALEQATKAFRIWNAKITWRIRSSTRGMFLTARKRS